MQILTPPSVIGNIGILCYQSKDSPFRQSLIPTIYILLKQYWHPDISSSPRNRQYTPYPFSKHHCAIFLKIVRSCLRRLSLTVETDVTVEIILMHPLLSMDIVYGIIRTNWADTMFWESLKKDNTFFLIPPRSPP